MTLVDFKHLPREARDTLFLLAVIGWVIMPQVAYSAHMVYCVHSRRAHLASADCDCRLRRCPARWWLLALLLITMAATFITHRSLLGREAGVTLIVILLALKTLELRARRDALVIFFFGFFTLLTGFFQSQSLTTAFVMLVALVGLLTALINAHRPVGHPSFRSLQAWLCKWPCWARPSCSFCSCCFRVSHHFGIPATPPPDAADCPVP